VRIMRITSLEDLFPNMKQYLDTAHLRKGEAEELKNVKASEVYKFLRIDSGFDQWFKYHAEGMPLIEGKDYVRVDDSGSGVDYLISDDLSKMLCMASDGFVAKQVRNFYIKIANFDAELKKTQNTKDYDRVYSEYLVFCKKAKDRINAGLAID